MIHLKEGAGLVVAGDVQSTVAAVDDALLNSARMCASVLEATQGAKIPVQHTQELLRAISESISSVLDGRDQLVTAIRKMNTIKDRSNLAVVNYGCPDGWATAKAPAMPPEAVQTALNCG